VPNSMWLNTHLRQYIKYRWVSFLYKIMTNVTGCLVVGHFRNNLNALIIFFFGFGNWLATITNHSVTTGTDQLITWLASGSRLWVRGFINVIVTINKGHDIYICRSKIAEEKIECIVLYIHYVIWIHFLIRFS